MATPTAFDFATNFVTGMSRNITLENYIDEMKYSISLIDRITKALDNIVIDSQEMFDKACNLKGRISHIYCYAFNNDLPEFKQICDVELALGKKMQTWTKSKLANKDDNLLIRYILWNRRYVNDKDARRLILDTLVERGYVHIDNDGDVVITGLYCKVGDNVFSSDWRGRMHRTFIDVCIPQCFNPTWDFDTEYLKTKNLPLLNGEHTNTWFGDGKGCARHPKITQKDCLRLRKLAPL